MSMIVDDNRIELYCTSVSADSKAQTSFTFQICSQLGRGRTCEAFEVQRVDEDGTDVTGRLKHFSPIGLKPNDERYKQEKDRFLASYELQKTFCSSQVTGGATVYAIDLLQDTHGELFLFTPYMPGQTFDKIQFKTFSQLIQSMRLLTESVGSFHQMGYLLLDIKPENVFISNAAGIRAVQFFDFDSFLNISKFHAGLEVPYSASTGNVYCALEIKRNRQGFISESTDLYSIAAMLYTSLCKDPDKLSTFSFAPEILESDIKDEFKVNFRLHREMISDILLGCLSYPPERRKFHSAEQLSKAFDALETACADDSRKLSLKTQYSRNHHVSNTPIFAPCLHYYEPDALKDICTKAFAHEQVFAIYGEPGIGKTELARAYVRKSSLDSVSSASFTDVIFANAAGKTLRNVIESLEIGTDTVLQDENAYEYRLKCLSRMSKLNGRCLLVIDNFDEHTDELSLQNSHYQDLLNSGWFIFITSRCNLSRIPGGSSIKIEALSYKTRMDLLKDISGFSPSPEEAKQLLDNVLLGNTYLTILTASLLRQEQLSISDVIRDLSNGNAAHIGRPLLSQKDGQQNKRDFLDNLFLSLYSLSFLDASDLRSKIMKNLTLCPLDGIRYDDFFVLFSDQSDRSAAECEFYDLCDNYWAFKTENLIHIHPLIRKLILTELPIEWDDIAHYVKFCLKEKAPVSQVTDVAERLNVSLSILQAKELGKIEFPLIIEGILNANVSSGYDILTYSDEAGKYGRIAISLLGQMSLDSLTQEDLFSVATAYSYAGYSVLHEEKGDYLSVAHGAIDKAGKLISRIYTQDSDNQELFVLMTQIHGNLGAVNRQLGKYDIALRYHTTAVEERKAALKKYGIPRYKTLLGTAKRSMASDYFSMSKSEDNSESAWSQLMQAYTLDKESIELYQESLGRKHLEIAVTLNRLVGIIIAMSLNDSVSARLSKSSLLNEAYNLTVHIVDYFESLTSTLPKNEVSLCENNFKALVAVSEKYNLSRPDETNLSERIAKISLDQYRNQ